MIFEYFFLLIVLLISTLKATQIWMTFCPALYWWVMFERAFFFLASSSYFLRCSSCSLRSFSSWMGHRGSSVERGETDTVVRCWRWRSSYRQSGLPLLLSLRPDPLLLCSLGTPLLLWTETLCVCVCEFDQKHNDSSLTDSRFCLRGRWDPLPLSSSGRSEPRSETAAQTDPWPAASCGCPSIRNTEQGSQDAPGVCQIWMFLSRLKVFNEVDSHQNLLSPHQGALGRQCWSWTCGSEEFMAVWSAWGFVFLPLG